MSTVAILLVFVGATLMVAEAHVASHGVLGTGAALALAAGVALALSGAGAPAFATVAAGAVVALGGLSLAWLLLVKSLATRRMAVRTGSTAPAGRVGAVGRGAGPGGACGMRAGAGRSGAAGRRALARACVGVRGGARRVVGGKPRR